jgi:hypothetical protein
MGQLGGVQTMSETVDHPKHYNVGSIEVIDFIEDQQLGFHLGNAVKYITRAQHKGERKDDIEKAIWYLRRFLGENKKVLDPAMLNEIRRRNIARLVTRIKDKMRQVRTGSCRVLSKGDACDCWLCDLDRLAALAYDRRQNHARRIEDAASHNS